MSGQQSRPRVRLGIVGCGAIVREAHLPVIAADPGVEVAMLCDRDRGNATRHRTRVRARGGDYGGPRRPRWKGRRGYRRGTPALPRADHDSAT